MTISFTKHEAIYIRVQEKFISLQCFDTVGWAAEEHLACKKLHAVDDFDWSFASLTAPVVTTTSINLSRNKIQNREL